MQRLFETIEAFTRERVEQALAAYRVQPSLLEEHLNIERGVQSSGYRNRQLFELIQNAADALAETNQTGRVMLHLAGKTLYCANEGAPLAKRGVEALLQSHLATKKGAQIGRFGIGFKSVAAICDAPEIFSSSLSVRFGPTSALLDLFPNHAALPVLRTCEVLDAAPCQEQDPRLADFCEWATTVVRLQVSEETAARFAKEFAIFPATFLLFCGFVNELRFCSDQGDRTIRVAGWDAEDTRITLQDCETTSQWRVFETSIDVSELDDAAQNDMDKRIDRQTLPLTWAVPLESRQASDGRLWAFFPTDERTTVSGIINAPWNTHSDRRQLLEGPFNDALLTKAAELIAAHVPGLMTDEDPTRYLEVLPARDDRGWADKVLTDHLFEALAEKACLPNHQCQLVMPSSLSIRPKEAKEKPFRDWLNEFHDAEPSELVHRTVENDTRRFRAARLGANTLTLKDWVRLVAEQRTPYSSKAAILLLATVLKEAKLNRWDQNQLKEVPCVLGFDEQLHKADPRRLALSSSADKDGQQDGKILVHPEVARDLRVSTALHTVFGLKNLDDSTERFESYLHALNDGGEGDWDQLWTLFREMGPKSQRKHQELFEEQPGLLKVKAADGSFLHPLSLLWPGEVVGPDIPGSKPGAYCDVEFHRPEEEWLPRLVPSRPRVIHDLGQVPSEETLYHQHLTAAREAYRRMREQANKKKPHANLLNWVNAEYVMPLDPLRVTSGEAKARLTKCLLEFLRTRPTWMMGHETARTYQRVSCKSPLQKLVHQHGVIPTSLGLQPCSIAVGHGLQEFAYFLAVLDLPGELTEPLQLPDALSEVKAPAVKLGLVQASKYDGPPESLARFYGHLAKAGHSAPEVIRACGPTGYTNATPDEVSVVDSAPNTDTESETLYLPCSEPELVDALTTRWGLKTEVLGELGCEPSSSELPLLDRFPSLGPHAAKLRDWSVQPCLTLWRERRDLEEGLTRIERFFDVEEPVIYCSESLTDEELFDRVQQLFEIGDDDGQPPVVTAEQVAAAPGSEERLLVALGEDALRAGIEPRHLELVGPKRPGTGKPIARLAHCIHGTDVLRHYRDSLERRGLAPPVRWNGSNRAISFVKSLGFPEQYAGARQEDRLPWEDVAGPMQLPSLHDFQDDCRRRMISFLQEANPGRGLLSLPTGAGKTRVAVQSLIEGYYKREKQGLGIWLAQNDELCEQAVESWRQAWSCFAGEGSNLRINRMWGKTNDRVQPHADEATLVVATHLSLKNRLGSEDFDWLDHAGFVVIDEAHHAVAPSYTEILAHFGNDHRLTAVPLIGLTATPFRGQQNVEETVRLVNRFGKRRFDSSGDDPEAVYRDLQARGILAIAEHEELEGGTVTLTPSECSSHATFHTLPASAEARLGSNPDRSRQIFEHIRRQPPDRPILVFATSVQHAEDLAVQLAYEGVTAAYVVGATNPARRRQTIGDFKAGRIQVLVNYGVLTSGFDAPSVRVVYITRPVFSPVLYQQMIGRGLRGPKNGGKERCLFVNVRDNIENFGQRLAFDDFEFLWSDPILA